MPWCFTVFFTVVGVFTFSLFGNVAYANNEAEEDKNSPFVEEGDFTLQWPLDCNVFEDCFIENYPDLTAGTNPAAPVDYKCGRRTAPGVQGITVVFRDRNTTQAGQPVLAAAPGRVLFIETRLSDLDRYSSRSQKSCGNYVVVRHSATHRTKYCHLRQDSINVEIGQKVEVGEKLAEIGSSGATEQPQLYFELQAEGQPIDPFTSRPLNAPSECFSLADKSLWKENIPYPQVGVVAASFEPIRPTPIDLEFKTEQFEHLPSNVPVLSAWIKLFGIEKGDIETLSIIAPNGRLWHRTERLHPIAANFWTAIVSATPSAPLQPGVWEARYSLLREGVEVFTKNFSVTVTDATAGQAEQKEEHKKHEKEHKSSSEHE